MIDMLLALALAVPPDPCAHLPPKSMLGEFPSWPVACQQKDRWREHVNRLEARHGLLAGFARDRERVWGWIEESKRRLHFWEVLVAAHEVQFDPDLTKDCREKIAYLLRLSREEGPPALLPENLYPKPGFMPPARN